jgi:hypothetical protein
MMNGTEKIKNKKNPLLLYEREGGGIDDFHVSRLAKSAMANVFIIWRSPKKFNVPNVF